MWTSIACSSDGARVVASSHDYYWDIDFGVPRTMPSSLIYMSTNFGVNWKSLSAPATNWGRVAMSADGTKLFAGAGVYAGHDTAGPVYASLDSGLSWHQIADSRFWRGLACSADGSTLLASADLVFISHDSGVTWQQAPMPSGTWRGTAMSSDGKKMAVINYSGFWRDPAALWTSVDSGLSWKPMGSVHSLVLVSSGDGSKLFAKGESTQPPAISTDWGVTWQQPGLYFGGCAAITYDGSKWFTTGIGSYGVVCSGDFGATWGSSDDSTIAPLSIACSSDAASVYVIDDRESMFSWQQVSARLNMDIQTNTTIVSWPSHRLSSRLQENSTLNPNDWINLDAQPTLTTNRMFRYVPRSQIDKAFYRLKTP
jgi:hypothetical protein